jgi:hypothetical protein
MTDAPSSITGVATDTIHALRATPILLVMVLLNCGFLGIAAYYLHAQQTSAYQLVDRVLDSCLPAQPPHSGQPP